MSWISSQAKFSQLNFEQEWCTVFSHNTQVHGQSDKGIQGHVPQVIFFYQYGVNALILQGLSNKTIVQSFCRQATQQ